MTAEITVDTVSPKRPRGRPRKNGVIPAEPAVEAKRKPGRPKGSKNKPKDAVVFSESYCEHKCDSGDVSKDVGATPQATGVQHTEASVKAELIGALHTLMTKLAAIDFSCLAKK